MLLFPKNDNKCSKNKCSDVFSKVEGKARNVDYIFSCKLRLLERLII